MFILGIPNYIAIAFFVKRIYSIFKDAYREDLIVDWVVPTLVLVTVLAYNSLFII